MDAMLRIAALRLALVVVSFSGGALGCQSALGGGIDAFHHADYPAAARSFRQAAGDLDAEDAGRYHLYVGLTHLALGNAALAVVHLTQARSAADAVPDYFDTEERARLVGAWRAMGRMPGQPLKP